MIYRIDGSLEGTSAPFRRCASRIFRLIFSAFKASATSASDEAHSLIHVQQQSRQQFARQQFDETCKEQCHNLHTLSS